MVNAVTKKNKNTQIARQHNDFIVAPHSLSQNAFKIFIFALSKIKTADKDLQEITLSLDEFKNILPRTKEHIQYDFIKTYLTELMDNDGVELKVGSAFKRLHFLKSIGGDASTGIFNIEFTQELKPYLIELKHYTKSSVELICSFRSFYSSRVYQILKMHFGKSPENNHCEIDYEIIKLREILEIPSNTYVDYGKLKREVIERAKKDINSNVLSDIKFDYTEYKGIGSKKVVGVKFQIRANTPVIIEQAEIVSPLEELKFKYNTELKTEISKIAKNLNSDQINKIKKHGGVISKNLTTDELKEHRLLDSWIIMSNLLSDSKKHLKSFEDWCIENKINLNE